jgi:YD repeat-containing protein
MFAFNIPSNTKINSSQFVFRKINWLGTLALIGMLFLFIGVSLSSAGVVEEKILPKIIKLLNDQGKSIHSTSVVDVSDKAEITVTLTNNEVRKYNDQGQLTKVTDKYGKVTLFEEGMPTEERGPDGAFISDTKYFKSSAGKLQKMVKRSAAGVLTKLYDNDGNTIQVTDSQGMKVFSKHIKNEEEKTTSYVETDLSSNKTLTNILDPKNGEVIAKIDSNNIRTNIENQYNEDGDKIGTIERDTAGNVVTKKYDDGQMVEETRNGIKTTFENSVNLKGVLTEKKEIKMIPSSNGMTEDVTIKKYDHQGRVGEMENHSGRHTYTYETNDEGRITTRNEKIDPKDGTEPTQKLTRYDETGKVIGTRTDNSETNITNVVDEKGNLVSSTEIITYKFGDQVSSARVIKEYDDNGNVITESDQYGKKSQNTYDGKGNRVRSENDDAITDYTYNDIDRMIFSIARDRKSMTMTDYAEDTKLAERKVMINNNGVVEITTYGITATGKRVSYMNGPFGVKVSVNRDATSDQPEQTTYTKYNGKVIISTYQYAGKYMIGSTEQGPDGITTTNYNGTGQPIESHNTDKWGREKFTVNNYAQGKIASSLLTDDKGKTITKFNKYGDVDKIIRKNEIGYPRKTEEDRSYKNAMLHISVSYDVKGKTITYYDENELPHRVHRVNYHGFPRENWTYNFYDEGGDIESSVQLDERGQTRNMFNSDGQMEDSVRLDIHGFPKRKATTYTYEDGELVSTITDTDRYTDYNKFDVDGLMRETTKKKKFGFPKTEYTIFEYDKNAYMTYSRSADVNGTTENFYNIDELVTVSHRVNTYGHARNQWTINEYNRVGYLTFSKETDIKGCTITEFDIDSLATRNIRYDQYGLEFSRNTITMNQYSGDGFMTTSLSKNLLSATKKEFDKDSLVRYSEQQDNYGLLNGRYKISYAYVYDAFGRIQSNSTEDDLGKTDSTYDIHGDATETIRFGKVGLYASRVTATHSEFQVDTGMTTSRISVSGFGTTISLGFDERTGLESKNISMNNFGLKGAFYTETMVDMDSRHGLQRYSKATNELGVTETWFDTWDGGPYGIAKRSKSENNFGLKGALVNTTEITASKYNGITQETMAKNELGITQTKYRENIGNAIWSQVKNNFGLKDARLTKTMITSSEYHGITEYTDGKNALGRTQTWYVKDRGNAERSLSDNNFGLTGAQHTETIIQSSEFHGITEYTDGINELGRTQTWYVEDIGNAARSVVDNNFGLIGAQHTETTIQSSEFHGITEYTDGINALGRTQTWYVKDIGNAARSVADNIYGLTGAQHTVTGILSSQFNGLNIKTFAVNMLSTVMTTYDDDK